MADFSCYITIVNLTPYKLKYSDKKDIHGSWKVDPPSSIDPFKTCAQFQLGDPAGAWVGTEGWVRFNITDDPTHTKNPSFTMKFNDPYGDTNNYAYIETSDAENYAVWFVTKVENEKDWSGINQIKFNGHPIYVQFYIQRMV